jgi:hypothetical protein
MRSQKKVRLRARKSSGRMASKGFPNPIDVHVGSRIRLALTTWAKIVVARS